MAAVTESMNVLLINDMCGFGKVALSAMMPVLSHMGFRLHNLPTALVSNTLNYPDFFIHDTTDYVKKTLPIWDELGFTFDAVSTGFIVTEEEARIIAEFCERQAAKGVRVFVDPIMGDNGSLYAGVPEGTIALMRRLVAQANIAMPNYTEACLLTGTPIDMEGGLTAEGATVLVDAMRGLGAKSVVITSTKVDNINAVVGYDAESDEYFTIPFDEVPVYFPGTGDIFSSVLLGRCSRVTPCATPPRTPWTWCASSSCATPTRRTSPAASRSRPAWTYWTRRLFRAKWLLAARSRVPCAARGPRSASLWWTSSASAPAITATSPATPSTTTTTAASSAPWRPTWASPTSTSCATAARCPATTPTP